MKVPRATYRLQLGGDLTLHDAAGLVPYLAELGVSHLYLSPCTRARAGSGHGYDVVDHRTIDPALGGEEGYVALLRVVRGHGMGLLLDWVPNHMGLSPENRWWMSVLEHGPASPYASFFDVDWDPPGRPHLCGRVLLPVLGDHYRAVLERGELKLGLEAGAGALCVRYHEHRFPLDPATYPAVLAASGEPELVRLAAGFAALPDRSPGRGAERARRASGLRERLARLLRESPGALQALEGPIRDPAELHRLLEEQAFRLAFWRVADDEVNYRRFFAINDLVGLRAEDGRVFEATHRLALDLLRRGAADGLRIDHPDGLRDPAGYLRRLREAAGGPFYLVVEKILVGDEELPEEWPVEGTTGYEFVNRVGGLFVDREGEEVLDRAYRRFTGEERSFEEVAREGKRLVMDGELAGGLDTLARRMLELSRRRYDLTLNALRRALAGVIEHLEVYRTYATPAGVPEPDRERLAEAIERASAGSRDDPTLFAFLRRVLLLEAEDPEERRVAAELLMDLQQYTGAVMAKGVEDTALYRYNRLAGLNEVGGEPDRFGVLPEELHRWALRRRERHPHGMLAASTHDTKRAEDVRARLVALSSLAEEWGERVERWYRTNAPHRVALEDGRGVPSREDEYLLYQTLLGTWPLGEEPGFPGRIKDYMRKAVREAKVNSSWMAPDGAYEAALEGFVEAILAPDGGFLEDFLPFQRRVARLGALVSLSQTLIRLTFPGVPDVYRGAELWDLSLVDPDNRRPVDYDLRRRFLAELERTGPSGAPSLLDDGVWQSGLPKLHLLRRALRLRAESPGLFARGEYVPLESGGPRAGRIFAFARRLGEELAVTVVPRPAADAVATSGPLGFLPGAWERTWVSVPPRENGYHNLLSGGPCGRGPRLAAEELFGRFPVALLVPVREA
ncbi:hypothetical protein Rxycam_02386 [Rubrobacter xylanophilus DSM 9941]|uniref:malto-oligosyltrehalose synthase n=1 Tax=Rubrobacter xylanophilus TaxID=49319 RepID=UPI001C63D0B7|nr:malto-oligosyltrehalose synthase [Rubrobacter xylanophilus]QYJ16553.1 hypothetical protein Rxycam_02386 [Rubrobacter xylanophilus DSM 9941]